MKYTQGEWFVSGGNEIVSMPSQCKITNRVSGWNQQEAEANAQLIANAPAMFEALKSIVEYWNTPQSGKSMNEHFERVITIAEQSVLKATI
jgi:hypothetical protein